MHACPSIWVQGVSKLSQIQTLMFFIMGLQMVVIWHSSSSSHHHPNAFTWPVICKWKPRSQSIHPGINPLTFWSCVVAAVIWFETWGLYLHPKFIVSSEKNFNRNSYLHAQASTHIYLQAWAWSTHMINVCKCVNWTHKGYGTYSGKFT